MDGIAERAIGIEADRIVVVDRWRGGLGKINLFQVSPTGPKSVPPLMLISGIRLRREFKTQVPQYPKTRTFYLHEATKI